jgi:N-acyl-L-homoserine lactone synthetase
MATNASGGKIMEYRVVKTIKEKEDVFSLRYRVFCLEKKWLNPEEYPDGKETDEYDQHSVHFLAANDTSKIVGTARAIFPSELGLPVFNNFEDIATPDDVERYVELSRLIVAKETRGLTVTIGLLKSILNWCLYEGSSKVPLLEIPVNRIVRHLKAQDKPFFNHLFIEKHHAEGRVLLSELNDFFAQLLRNDSRTPFILAALRF